MSDEAALLHAIGEHPDEDTPRLVYADWLDEHGTTEADCARAEFIRVQIDRARIPEDDDRQAELEARERELFAVYGKAWEYPAERFQLHAYRRGFVERLDPSADSFFDETESYEELLAMTPIRELHFDTYGFMDGYNTDAARHWR